MRDTGADSERLRKDICANGNQSGRGGHTFVRKWAWRPQLFRRHREGYYMEILQGGKTVVNTYVPIGAPKYKTPTLETRKEKTTAQ